MSRPNKILPHEAQRVLAAFLAEQPGIWEELAEEALLQEGIRADFSLQSVPQVVAWLSKRLRTLRLKEDPSIPEFIRNTESYKANLFEFDEKSRIWICRAGYYLGESFTRKWRCLRWKTGTRGNFEEDMPVVAGFVAGVEMSPIDIIDVVCSKGVTGSSVKYEMAAAVKAWVKDIPEEVPGNRRVGRRD